MQIEMPTVFRKYPASWMVRHSCHDFDFVPGGRQFTAEICQANLGCADLGSKKLSEDFRSEISCQLDGEAFLSRFRLRARRPSVHGRDMPGEPGMRRSREQKIE